MMKPMVRLMAIGAFVLLIVAPAALAQAPAPEVSTLPVVDTPLDVGGTILQPGTYVIRVVSPVADRHKVLITSVDGSEVFATLLTVPHHLEPGEKYPNTTFVFYPAGEGAPRALRTWFPVNPVSGHGHDIVYDESRAAQLARLANESQISTEPTPVPEPEPVTSAPLTTPVPEPVTTPMTSGVTADTQDTTELPQTAGEVPLVALLGLLSLGGAAIVRRARRV